MRRYVLALVLLATGCEQDFVPASYVAGLRVLAVKAEPPELAAGESGTLTMLAVDPSGRAFDVTWDACLLYPGVAAEINPACLTSEAATDFVPLGQGLAASLTMPERDLEQLGLPDATLGFYLPVRARVRAADAAVDAIYRVRYSLGLVPPNRNPTLEGVYLVPGPKNAPVAPEELVPLDEASPPEVRVGDEVVLRAIFTPDSAEDYLMLEGDPAAGATRTVTEILRVFWYATAGDFSDDATGGDRPDSVLRLTQRLPPVGPDGMAVDLWIVGREERGGTDYVHRTLRLLPAP